MRKQWRNPTMKLYHGSDTLVPEPNLQKCKPFKDFGKGFYLSADYSQAQKMAEQKSSLSNGVNPPIVSNFYFDESALTDNFLKVKCFNSYTEEWAEFVLRNRDRKNKQPYHNYDIVYGPIADDRIVRQMRRFELGDITLAELMRELKYPKGITFQYYFGSEKALSKLMFLC